MEDWPVYKVKCPTSDDRQKPKYCILHRNRLLLVTDGDASDIPGQAQAKVTPIISNATPDGKFCMKPWTQMVPEAAQSPPDLIKDEVSEPESEFSDSEPEGT